MKKMTEQFDDRLKSVLLDLTWKKMKVWADPDSVERGRGYLDNVEEPRQYPDGSVIAEVHGSEDYHTRLHIDDDGKLQGDCTCPVGYRCKHAVALALVAIKKFKAGEEMRRGATDDSLWKCAMSELAAWEPVEEDDDDDDDFGEEDFDDYSVLEGMEKNFATSLETDRAGWAKVASYALDRYAKGGEGWELYPIRDVCLALERAGRVDEAVSRLRDNLRDDKNWIPLVEILERNGRRDEALKLCRAGISSRRDEAGSAVYKLREKIRLMTCDGDDGKLSLAYDLDKFLDSYWFDAAEYRALREKCERFNVWERVHEFILRHLSTGCDLAAEEGWPLPKTGTSTTNDRIEGYPKLTLLIQIALEDGRPKDALAWYGQSVSGCGGIREYELDKLGWEVADAAVDCKPAEAVEIWMGYVHRIEREPGNSHYNQIGRAMQKLLPVMRSLGRLDEWRAEMSRLRESYCRRPNLMSILKDIEAGGNSIDLLED